MIIKNKSAILRLKKQLENFNKLSVVEQVRLINQINDWEKDIEEYDKNKNNTEKLKRNGFIGGDYNSKKEKE